MTDNRTVEQWTIRSIEDLYKKDNELRNILLKQAEINLLYLEKIKFLENKPMNKEEKEYIEKHGHGLTDYEISLLHKSFKENNKLNKDLSKL